MDTGTALDIGTKGRGRLRLFITQVQTERDRQAGREAAGLFGEGAEGVTAMFALHAQLL